jgi:hypothetical protein
MRKPRVPNNKRKPYVKKFGLDLNFGEGNIGGKIAGMQVPNQPQP